MAGAALVVGVLVTTASLGVTGVAGATALAESQRLAGVADAAALAAGDAMLGWVAEAPCDAATRVARANGALVAACSIEGGAVVVTVSGAALGLTLERSARAGAPGT